MSHRDREEVAAATGDLIGWIEKGGFLPNVRLCRPVLCDLGREDFLAYLRDLRAVAEMA